MSGFWWGVIIVGALWVYFSMRSKAKALKAFAAFDLAEPWFEEQGIKSSSVSFGTYDDASLVRTPSAIVLVGTGKSTMGEDVGFAVVKCNRCCEWFHKGPLGACPGQEHTRKKLGTSFFGYFCRECLVTEV